MISTTPDPASSETTAEITDPVNRRLKRIYLGLPLLTFALGLSLGYGLAGPFRPGFLNLGSAALSSLAGSSLGGLTGTLPSRLTALLDPLGVSKLHILVMGRDVAGDNTDVMFTVQVRDGITRITQLPRDTYVESDKHGVVKINSLFALGGVETTRTEVARLSGAPVDRYLKVNLKAVAKVGDALGGVEVDVPKPMHYTDHSQALYIDLEPGRQVLKGDKLLGFLRFRHDEEGDLGRMQRQRQVINQVFQKLAQPATLARLPMLLKIAGEDLLTDLSPIELTQLATLMATTKLSSERLPGRPYWEDQLSYWMPDSNRNHPTGHGDEPLY